MVRLRECVDAACERLRAGSFTFDQARRVIEETRTRVMEWFPEKGNVFDLILRPRFYRILDERIGDIVPEDHGEKSGIVET